MLKVTDPILLSALSKGGIDKRYVEFVQDYAKRGIGKSPYMKGYFDHLSGKHFAVISGLPMVDAYGFKHELVWQERERVLENGNNIFHCIVKDGTVRLIVLSDQPYGIKKDTECSYHAQLIINGSEISPNNPVPLVLATDPVNKNYHDNVLLIQYDTICKRRIRTIEGRFRERWIFESNPHSRVRIKHNLSGNLKLKLGSAIDARGFPLKVTVIGDEEIVEASEFDKAVFPVEIGADLTVYPDAGTGNTTVDGYVGHEAANVTWATLIGAAGHVADDTGIAAMAVYIYSDGSTDRWFRNRRFIATFDTSPLDGSTLTAVVLSLFGYYKEDQLSITPDCNIYAASPANNNALVAGDYDSLGSDPYCDTPLTYATMKTGAGEGYNDFTFNLTGRNAIVKDGITRLGAQNANYDVSGTPPNWYADKYSLWYVRTADQGAGYKPKLVATYTVPAPIPVADGDLIGIPVIRRS